MKSSNYFLKKTIIFRFSSFEKTHRGIETILTSFNVSLNYAYRIQISIFYSDFYYGKTWKLDPNIWKGDGFLQLFQSTLSQWINKLKASYLCQNNANDLVYHMSKNIAITKTFDVSKHRKSRRKSPFINIPKLSHPVVNWN